jgi:MFS family permease
MAQGNGLARITLPRKQHGIVTQVVDRWIDYGVIDTQTSAKLKGSLAIAAFDWQKTARYAFIVAIVCFVIAVSAVVADRMLMALLERLFSAPALAKCAVFAALAAAIFWAALSVRKKHSHRVYSTEAVFFIGVMALAVSVYFLGMAVGRGSDHYAPLFLIACVLYALLGLWFPSALVWVFALLSLGAWMGTETGYMAGYGAYFLGMNYPLRFVIFGAALTLLGMAGLLPMSPQTKVVGLLYLFIALWIMSIFGNYGDMNAWHGVRQYRFLPWALAFGAVAVAAIWYGLKRDDGVLRGFGLTFLFINLYTRFFEYFWDSMHKAIFFAVLALSFWFIGSRAERIWHFGQGKLAG